ncbi:MAG TPA: crosslink repair DNA glycosylase YcaQ family protein [Dokdonella sp.]|uniref:winged helix-turn-helix domain-containing protein n=1 Tax=Dokdonella sp. TaxID=2291710 RepID=UPI0025C72C65|nr:crosslink repair DNA glycosylase YcaQ family protein [Dokdonella sp.]MBX3693071.1 YcaQ family DNA glycosylase [Dokdonella sp.]MCW5567348.1 YcaQ family DNA glycosylase [Dokdonella sp.]HNR91564.1 crosslink repair DNA glycosylase YcaQ family protein [Dokdonella sp.]
MFAASASPIRLTARQARLVHLAAQGLLARPPARPTRDDALAAIARMQLLQIDTIHVVARSPYLVLFSRLGAYPSEWLEHLLSDGAIFEAWAHEACFVPGRDHALHRAHREAEARTPHWSDRNALRMHAQQRAGMDRLLAHIREHGAVKAADFERRGPKSASGWWEWKDEKRWLEALFARGELMVARRERFQRVYDLAERVIARLPAQASFDTDVSRELVLRSVRALGIAQARWIADYFRTGRKHRDEDLDALVDSGELVRIAVDGWKAIGYVHCETLPLVEAARAGRLRPTHTTLLSPFDPVVWHRERASTMFGFDYTLECYTPAPRRHYGYFVLPILHRGALVGRLDAKAHRAEGLFEVHVVHLEPGVEADIALARPIAAAIRACADWHGTPRVKITRSDPRAFAPLLRSAL